MVVILVMLCKKSESATTGTAERSLKCTKSGREKGKFQQPNSAVTIKQRRTVIVKCVTENDHSSDESHEGST